MLTSLELVRWTLTPLSCLIDSILLPFEEVVPPADLKLARFYGQSLRHAEAAEEYARVLRYHPRYADAYLEGIRTAGLAGDEKLARRFYQGAQKIMRVGDKRRLLENVYTACHQPLEVVKASLEEAEWQQDENRPR